MAWKRAAQLSKSEVNKILNEQRKRARFLVDESLGEGVLDVLRQLGWNAKSVTELRLRGQPDENVLAAAFREDRILLTHDRDFLDARRFPHHRNPGIVVLPGAQGDNRALLRGLGAMLAVVGKARDLYRQTRVAISDDGTWTVSTFEPDEGRVVTSRYRFVKGGTGIEFWEED